VCEQEKKTKKKAKKKKFFDRPRPLHLTPWFFNFFSEKKKPLPLLRSLSSNRLRTRTRKRERERKELVLCSSLFCCFKVRARDHMWKGKGNNVGRQGERGGRKRRAGRERERCKGNGFTSRSLFSLFFSPILW